jgi:SAM-dependent methyltransferase
MELESYYKYQAEARNVTTLNHVMHEMCEKERAYKAVIYPWLPESKDAIIFEAGCGPGIFMHWLKKMGYKNLSGVDSSGVQVELAKAGGLNVQLVDALVAIKALKTAMIDCVVALDFYEHLQKEILLDFFKESNRILKKGGVLILRGPNGDSPMVGRALYNDITHHWCLTSIAFTALTEMFGFVKCEFRDDVLAGINKYRFIHVPLSWAAQYFLRIIIKLSIRENIKCLAASFYVCARK